MRVSLTNMLGQKSEITMLKNKDPDMLRKISKDLYYEVSHLIELFLLLTLRENNEIIRHAFLESLLIHASVMSSL